MPKDPHVTLLVISLIMGGYVTHHMPPLEGDAGALYDTSCRHIIGSLHLAVHIYGGQR